MCVSSSPFSFLVEKSKGRKIAVFVHLEEKIDVSSCTLSYFSSHDGERCQSIADHSKKADLPPCSSHFHFSAFLMKNQREVIIFVPLSSVQSLGRLGHQRDIRDNAAEMFFQTFMWEAIVSSSGIDGDAHSLIFSIQHVLC